ncbi:hypothetical protein AALP_AAs42163U000100 [Arabis alpina]|uniref:Uncharacterized protein n=1 Tax=Arabis alpina TaxID=50452 RepID=A0A087G1A1_ARAAL|nr:hypothetical protein AALP_AAs42163U000100 [Arabis alpina]
MLPEKLLYVRSRKGSRRQKMRRKLRRQSLHIRSSTSEAIDDFC